MVQGSFILVPNMSIGPRQPTWVTHANVTRQKRSLRNLKATIMAYRSKATV